MRIVYEEKDTGALGEERIVSGPNIYNLLSRLLSWLLSGFQKKTTTDSAVPDLSYLRLHFSAALESFYATIQKIIADNPVDTARLSELAAKAAAGALSEPEAVELNALKASAVRQGRAVGGVYGFFLKYRPYPMLAEIRDKEKLFQPAFGPVIVVHGGSVRELLTRHEEFSVDPYGREMIKSMTPKENGGFDTFILSTDDADKYLDDKALLTAVINEEDASRITDLIHQDSLRRIKQAVRKARTEGHAFIDVVSAVARFVPVTLAHHYLGVPAAEQKGSFELSDDMLRYYGSKVSGPDGKTPLPTSYRRPDGDLVELPDSALARCDGVIPDELQIYLWVKSAFQNFFNNVQKDIEVQARGVRAYRELLVYILRKIGTQGQALRAGEQVADTMLTRLLKLQLQISNSTTKAPPTPIDSSRLSDIRIAENIMGTIVGAIAGQEEATCRVIDSMMRLNEGEYEQEDSSELNGGERYGSFAEARRLILNILEGHDVEESRRILHLYVLEALRLQPQGEVLLRECTMEGATIAGSRPIRAGTLIFAAHGSAMQDVEKPKAFIIGRDADVYLQHGYGRHRCLGQYVSPVIMVEALVAVLALNNLRRPEPRPDEMASPLERRFGRLQLDDGNLYATTFTLEFDHGGATSQYFA